MDGLDAIRELYLYCMDRYESNTWTLLYQIVFGYKTLKR